MMLTVLVSLLAGCSVSLLAQPLVRIWLVNHDLLDRPNHRSSHTQPVPRGGGIGIVVGVFAGLIAGAWTRALPSHLLIAVVATICVGFAVLGFVDDRRALSATTRLIAQFALGLLVVLAVATGLEAPQAATLQVVLAVIVSILWIPAYTNAFNFMDGINGIAALQGIIAGAFFTLVAVREDLAPVSLLAAVTAGACLGFLPWNMPRARLFMGDVGSYAVGSLLASVSLWLWWAGVPLIVCAAPLTVFLADTGWALIRRLAGGRPLSEAHREHVYQRLVDGGWSHNKSTGFSTVATILVSGASLLTEQSVGVTGILIVLILVGYLTSPVVFIGRRAETLSESLR